MQALSEVLVTLDIVSEIKSGLFNLYIYNSDEAEIEFVEAFWAYIIIALPTVKAPPEPTKIPQNPENEDEYIVCIDVRLADVPSTNEIVPVKLNVGVALRDTGVGTNMFAVVELATKPVPIIGKPTPLVESPVHFTKYR
jgi:hypothetical protein